MAGEKPLTTLAVAIERQQWELAALCLLLGVTRAAAALPPDALEGLIEVLDAGPERRQRGRTERSGPHGRRT